MSVSGEGGSGLILEAVGKAHTTFPNDACPLQLFRYLERFSLKLTHNITIHVNFVGSFTSVLNK